MMNFSAATAAVSERTHHQHVSIKSLSKRFIEALEIGRGSVWPRSLSEFTLRYATRRVQDDKSSNCHSERSEEY
jgi:hypothetical protein